MALKKTELALTAATVTAASSKMAVSLASTSAARVLPSSEGRRVECLDRRDELVLAPPEHMEIRMLINEVKR